MNIVHARAALEATEKDVIKMMNDGPQFRLGKYQFKSIDDVRFILLDNKGLVGKFWGKRLGVYIAQRGTGTVKISVVDLHQMDEYYYSVANLMKSTSINEIIKAVEGQMNNAEREEQQNNRHITGRAALEQTMICPAELSSTCNIGPYNFKSGTLLDKDGKELGNRFSIFIDKAALFIQTENGHHYNADTMEFNENTEYPITVIKNKIAVLIKRLEIREKLFKEISKTKTFKLLDFKLCRVRNYIKDIRFVCQEPCIHFRLSESGECMLYSPNLDGKHKIFKNIKSLDDAIKHVESYFKSVNFGTGAIHELDSFKLASITKDADIDAFNKDLEELVKKHGFRKVR